MTLKRWVLAYLIAIHLLLAVTALWLLREHRLWLYGVEALFLLSIIAAYILCSRTFARPAVSSLGPEFLKERDFQSRFRTIGHPEVDHLIQLYNSIAESLQSERIKTQEKEFFLAKLLEASPAGVGRPRRARTLRGGDVDGGNAGQGPGPGRGHTDPRRGDGGRSDRLGAASSTGWGESILRTVLAKTAVDALARRRLPSSASALAVRGLERVHGCGGVILVDRLGRAGAGFNTPRMARGIATERGGLIVAVLREEGRP